jgi:hypothetical protein
VGHDMRGHSARITALVVGHGMLVSGSLDGSVRFWDVVTTSRAPRCIQTVSMPTLAGVSSLAQPVGAAHVVVGTTDGRVVILVPPLVPDDAVRARCPQPQLQRGPSQWGVGSVLAWGVPRTHLARNALLFGAKHNGSKARRKLSFDSPAAIPEAAAAIARPTSERYFTTDEILARPRPRSTSRTLNLVDE